MFSARESAEGFKALVIVIKGSNGRFHVLITSVLHATIYTLEVKSIDIVIVERSTHVLVRGTQIPVFIATVKVSAPKKEQ